MNTYSYVKIVQQTITVQDFTFKTDSSFFNFFSLGSTKLKNNLHSSTTLMADVNNFIKKRVTAKSSDLTSCLATEKHSSP